MPLYKNRGLFLSLNKRFSYSNLTDEEKKAIYSFRDGSSIIIMEAHKGFGIIVLYRSKYLAEPKTQIEHKEICQKLIGNVEKPLTKSEKQKIYK